MEPVIKCDTCRKKLTTQEIKQCVCNYCDRAICRKCVVKDEYYTLYHCGICGETYCYFSSFFSGNEYECRGRSNPCKCNLLDQLSSDLKNVISNYTKALTDIAEAPLTEEELTWLLNLRREIVSVHIYTNYCEIQYWTPRISNMYSSVPDVCRARIVCVDFTDIRREPIYDRELELSGNKLVKKLLKSLSAGEINEDLDDADDVNILDFKSMFMILKRRFSKINKRISLEYAKKSALKFLNDIYAYVYCSEEYMFSSMTNMEVEYDMCEDVCYRSVIEDAVDEM